MIEHLHGYTDWPHSQHAHTPCAVALGIFDGVHLGHQTLLRTVRDHAQQENLTAAVLTFSPHPAKVLNPACAPKLLEPIHARIAHMQAHGIQAVVVQPFDRLFASNTAEAFVRDVLVAVLNVRHVVVGQDFVFGKKQQGNVALLKALGERHRFCVHACPPYEMDGMVVSSTRIRACVHQGDMPKAAALLGRPYRLWGTTGIVAPWARGLWQAVTPAGEQLPAPGRYAAWAVHGQSVCQALVHVGTHHIHAHRLLTPQGGAHDAHKPLYYALVMRLGDPLPQEAAYPEALWAKDTAEAKAWLDNKPTH